MFLMFRLNGGLETPRFNLKLFFYLIVITMENLTKILATAGVPYVVLPPQYIDTLLKPLTEGGYVVVVNGSVIKPANVILPANVVVAEPAEPVKTITADDVKARLIEKGISESSIKVYASSFRRFMTGANLSGDIVREWFNIDNVRTYLKSLGEDKYTLQKNMLNAINHYAETAGCDMTDLKALFNELVELSDAQRINVGKNEKEHELMPKFEELKDKLVQYKAKMTGIYSVDWQIATLLIIMHDLKCVFRNQDYINTKVLTADGGDAENYINLTSGQMVINEYKTKKVHGQRRMKLSAEAVELIKSVVKCSGSQWLFAQVNDRTKPMSTTHFNNICTKHLGTGCQMFRKSFVTSEVPKMSPKKKVQTAKAMGHKVSTQQGIYLKK